MTIAALYVDPKGAYSGLPGVEVWDKRRDARLYPGPHRGVYHPPCSRWCRLAGLVQKRWGHRKGDDGGCFAAALRSVRIWGGVLEHPAYSAAWIAHGLTPPPSGEGWHAADWYGGWTCYVEQGRYGHAAKKATWLLAYQCELPSLRWGRVADNGGAATHMVSWCRNHSDDPRPRLGKAAAAATPPGFRDVLLEMARGPRPGSG